MGDSFKGGEIETDAVRRLCEAYAHIFQKRGYNIDDLLRTWTQQQKDKLISPGAREDFEELAGDECVPQVLAVLVVLLLWSPKIESFWEKVYGSSDERLKVQKVLVRAADAVEQLFSFAISLEDDEIKTAFAEIGRLTPLRLTSELKAYARFLDFLDRFPRDIKTRSFKDFLRFLLADYVKAATGRFRDRNVSGILAEVLGQSDYNEVAHRMWRHRNFNRMKKHYPRISDLLLSFGQVITSRA